MKANSIKERRKKNKHKQIQFHERIIHHPYVVVRVGRKIQAFQREGSLKMLLRQVNQTVHIQKNNNLQTLPSQKGFFSLKVKFKSNFSSISRNLRTII
jgi:hypothetical protein